MTEQNITFQDLANLVSCVDAAASRGAYRGEELEQVGRTRNIVASFVKVQSEAARAEQDENTLDENFEPQLLIEESTGR